MVELGDEAVLAEDLFVVGLGDPYKVIEFGLNLGVPVFVIVQQLRVQVVTEQGPAGGTDIAQLTDLDGDDNPDIEDFMGNFEFSIVYRKNDYELGLMLRNNLDTDENRGAIQLDWTFPMHRRFRGYVQVFNGYGESLIDYDANITRVGIGILLSDLL